LRLKDKVVLVSGGASGIGAETARLVLREGGKAVLADRDEAKGRALAAELGGAALFLSLDVTQEASWQKVVAASVKRFGGLHGLLMPRASACATRSRTARWRNTAGSTTSTRWARSSAARPRSRR
jgi:NAD(P)-dependent dehydrogenase (short-subunit alcohol dehydrogenase family)